MLENIYILLKSNSYVDQAVLNDWLRTEGISNDSFYCEKCEMNMSLNRREKNVDKEIFKCKKCCSTRSIRWRTYFYDKRFSIYELLQLVVLFVEDEYVKDVYNTGFYSKPKIVAFFGTLRKVCTNYCDETFIRIGADAVVEIDETVISKRKYNRGEIVNSKWLFGCIERATYNFCLRMIDNKSRPALESVMSECIILDLEVHSDCWSSYMSLFASTYDYQHYSVNHSQNLVDPVTRAHTQSIESLWSRLKRVLRNKGLSKYQSLNDYLGESTFRIKTKKIPHQHVFFHLLKDLNKFF